MAKRAGSKLRMLYIMGLLLEKSDEEHHIPVREITEMLEKNGISADRKTLYDDIETLKLWGMDILYSREKPSGYYVGSRRFQLPELKLLVDAVQASRFITVRKSRELIKKLESLASTGEAKQLQRQVVIANRTKAVNESIYYNVDKINDAVLDNRKISFIYYKWNTDKELIPKHDGRAYIISPWIMTWENGNYYMIGFDEDSDRIKHYRVDKMRDINILEDHRAGEDAFRDFDIALYLKNTFRMFGGQVESVTIEFDNKLIGVAMDRFGTDVMVQKVSDNHFRIKHDVTVSGQFYGWIAGLGTDVRIVHPQSVVDGFREHIKAIADLYD